jgi:hypothetical protein
VSVRLTLTWTGPVGPGRFPTDPLALEALARPGVYLRVKRYGRGRTVGYVGQSRNVLVRIDQHLTSALGLLYPARDADGVVRSRGDLAARIAAYNGLAAAARLAAEDAARTRFYVAHCGDEFDPDYLSLAEGALKRRLEARIGAATDIAAVENRQGIVLPEEAVEVVIENDYAVLAPAEREIVAGLLGDTPIEVAALLAEIGHAG